MNNIELIIEEQKRKSLVINNLVIDLQYIQTLVAQLFAANAASLPEYKDGYIALINLSEKAAEALRELKLILPVPINGSDNLDVLEVY